MCRREKQLRLEDVTTWSHYSQVPHLGLSLLRFTLAIYLLLKGLVILNMIFGSHPLCSLDMDPRILGSVGCGWYCSSRHLNVVSLPHPQRAPHAMMCPRAGWPRLKLAAFSNRFVVKVPRSIGPQLANQSPTLISLPNLPNSTWVMTDVPIEHHPTKIGI